MQNFSDALIIWYQNHKRDLPWRNTNDPYLIWVSEIILQQTQVQTGLLYYQRIISQFPDITLMAKASEDTILKLWQGMGYYSRARNMHHTAQYITEHNQGKFPSTYHDILQLKGVGPYTAAAIASFAYGLPHAVVDGNVYRLLSRCFGISEPIDSTEGKKIFHDLASKLLNKSHPGIHNQAVMEIGSLICRPASPLCNECPVNSICVAKKESKINLLPVKSKILTQKKRYLYYLFINNNEHTFIRKRNEKDIWKGLYELPSIEKFNAVTPDALNGMISDFLNTDLPIDYVMTCYPAIIHKLTHQILHIQFIEVKMSFPKIIEKSLKTMNYSKINLSHIHNFAFPKPIEMFFDRQTDRQMQ